MNRSSQNLVNCKTCGDTMDVSKDPENWQLQCKPCKKQKIPLPKGYEDLVGGPHDK